MKHSHSFSKYYMKLLVTNFASSFTVPAKTFYYSSDNNAVLIQKKNISMLRMQELLFSSFNFEKVLQVTIYSLIRCN